MIIDHKIPPEYHVHQTKESGIELLFFYTPLLPKNYIASVKDLQVYDPSKKSHRFGGQKLWDIRFFNPGFSVFIFPGFFALGF